MTMFARLHVENSGPGLGSNRTIYVYFPVIKWWHPLRRHGAKLIQEALPRAIVHPQRQRPGFRRLCPEGLEPRELHHHGLH
jgi:hypothetical protein